MKCSRKGVRVVPRTPARIATLVIGYSAPLIGALLLLAIAMPAAAKPQKPKDAAGAEATIGVSFSTAERQAIISYFAPNGRGGTERGKPLPPGIAKKLARGGTLPPGIAKRYLPRDLDGALPPPYLGTERIIVGNDVLLVQVSTGAILDFVRQALR